MNFIYTKDIGPKNDALPCSGYFEIDTDTPYLFGLYSYIIEHISIDHFTICTFYKASTLAIKQLILQYYVRMF